MYSFADTSPNFTIFFISYILDVMDSECAKKMNKKIYLDFISDE